MEDNLINDLKKQIYQTEIKKNNLDQEIQELLYQKKILIDNENLNQKHIQNEEKISNYKAKLDDHKAQIKSNQQRISELKSEIMSQKKVIQGRVQEILDIARENDIPVIFVNKSKNENHNNLNNHPGNEINDLEDKGNLNKNEENIIDNVDDEEKEIKNKLFNLFQDKEKVEKLYEEVGKDQICQLFDAIDYLACQKISFVHQFH